LSLYKIAYDRIREKEKDHPNKWWFQDLSNENFVQRIKALSEVKIIVKKIHDDASQKETGSIISAMIPFPLNLYEKNIIEKQLEYYAFNKLYPKQGLNIYRDVYNDTASIIVIINTNDMKYTTDIVSIY